MNRNTRTCRAIKGALLMMVLASGLAHADGRDNCLNVRGRFRDDSSSGRTLGTIREAGILTGRTERVFTSAGMPTPDPTAVSFTGDYSVTTRQGMLVTHDLYVFEFAHGAVAGIHRIDPAASTGVFAGATGVLWDTGKAVSQFVIEGEIAGEVCFANRR